MVNLTRDSRSSQEVRSARRGIQILGLWNCPDSQKRQETVSVEVSHVTLISIESDVGVEVQRILDGFTKRGLWRESGACNEKWISLDRVWLAPPTRIFQIVGATGYSMFFLVQGWLSLFIAGIKKEIDNIEK
jgi:hypothetical protein